MGFTCGLVGLPGVGKTTVFRALVSTEGAAVAPSANPLDPNRHLVTVPDARLDELSALYQPRKTIPARLEVVDIPGLARGASHGEGLGNQFLGHIKDVEAVLHVVRCFEDPRLPHAFDTIDPARDVETVDLELVFKDIETVARKIERLEKKARHDKALAEESAHCAAVKEALEKGIPARKQELSPAAIEAVRECNLLTLKTVLYIANVKEDQLEGNAHAAALSAFAGKEGAPCVIMAAKAEADLAELDPGDREEFMEALGVRELARARLIREGYRALGLGTMFTVGEDECRAWTIPLGAKAPQAAGKIHTDMEKGFIRLEVMEAADLLALGSEAKVKAAGKHRLEGKDYEVQDGDVVVVRFNK